MNGFCYIEIPTTDIVKSKEFYGQIFAWTFEDSQDGYIMFKPPKGLSGGFTKQSKPTTDGILLYIEVDDIEKKLTQIEQYGGTTVTPKTKISDEYGYFAVFTDPCINRIGLWSKS